MFGLTEHPIDVIHLLQEVTSPESGAVVIFCGTVRNWSEGKFVKGIHYEAYPPMAEERIRAIGKEMQERWGIHTASIVHRIGQLAVGEVSVAIVVASPHRESAFSACRFAIEQIKTTVPIWKKEIYADETEAWVKGEKLRG